MLAGVGLFLLGMSFLEESLRILAGRRFKLFLKNQSSNKLKAVMGGIVVSAVLQSSSIVNLMVLALVGGNVLRLENALAIILGSNIGTTLDSWVVALVGFKFSIEALAFPMLGIAGILKVLWLKGSPRHTWAVFFFGLGAVFSGLEFMKNGFSGLAREIDFSVIHDYPLVFFLAAGLVLTTLIQSSYAMMAIALSAVHAGAIEVLPAIAVVLGAEVGTTVKLVVASMGDSGVKRQVAYGNFIYNFAVISLAFIFIRHLHDLLELAGISDPMIMLVSFQSLINFAGALLFLPFLSIAAGWLNRKFPGGKTSSAFIQDVPNGAGDLGIDNFEKEARRFLLLTLDYIKHAAHSRRSPSAEVSSDFYKKTVADQYDFLKSLHGEIHTWYIGQRKLFQEEPVAEHADRLISAVRNTMFAAKSIHDSASDIQQLRNSSKDEKYLLYDAVKKEIYEFCQRAEALLEGKSINIFEDLVSFYDQIRKDYGAQVSKLYADGVQMKLSETDISTLINFSRERFSGYKSVAWALKDLLLDKKEAAYFTELPGFIR